MCVETHSKHIIALHFFSFLANAVFVKLSEEIEGYDGVEIHHDRQQTHSQHQLRRQTYLQGEREIGTDYVILKMLQIKCYTLKEYITYRASHPGNTRTDLFSIVCDGGKNGTECLKAHGDVQKVGSKEEVVIMTQNRHGHVPRQVQEGLKHTNTHTHKLT